MRSITLKSKNCQQKSVTCPDANNTSATHNHLASHVIAHPQANSKEIAQCISNNLTTCQTKGKKPSECTFSDVKVCPLADSMEHCRVISDSSSEPQLPTQEEIQKDIIAKHKDRILSSWPATTPHAREKFPDFSAIYECVEERGLPNFLGARIPLDSDLVIHRWEQLLQNYHDKELVLFLKFGWPVGYQADAPPSSADSNHQSAARYPSHVKSFIQKELQHKAILGPFKDPPFTPWFRVSPLMTRPKKDSHERCIIMDLSYPHGVSPNDGIDIYDHFGKDISYSLPSITDLVTKLQLQGSLSWIWKADLLRAYRQIRIDPLDTPCLASETRIHITST